MKKLNMVAVLAFAAAVALGAASCKDNMSPSMLANMGGMEGVSKLMGGWAGNVAANPTLSKTVTPDNMSMIAKGLTNEIANASQIPIPNAGVSLPDVLKGMNLPSSDLTALGDALKATATTNQLSPEATKGVMSLWDNTVKGLNKK